MERSLEAIRFLANSANRVQILETLVGDEATRRSVQERVDGSRSTVARILEECQRRDWVDSEGSRYWLTPLGRGMITDFCSFLETVEGYQQLGSLVNHFPPPLFDLDFRHLRDADVIELVPENPAAPFTRSLHLFQEASEYRGLNNTALPEHVKVIRDRVEGGDVDFEQIFEQSFIETIRADEDRAAVWTPLADGVWLYDDVVPINLHIVDGTVLVWLGKTRSTVAGLLESENDAVLSWAESLYESYRTESEPIAGFE
jgi:predicted transcriptional regulator